MRSIGKRFKKSLSKYFNGKRKFSGVFEKLHELSLAGLNFGGGDNVSSSGEKNVIEHLRATAGRGARPVAFDVGANEGKYALELCSALKGDADIYCFEPSRKAFDSLVRNTGSRGCVKSYNIGFGADEGRKTIYFDHEGSPLASLYKRRMDHLGVESGKTEEVTIKTIDGFCSENGISRIDLLKIDTEGGELDVLKGAKGMIGSGSIEIIQFEFGAFNIASRTFFQDFFFLLNPDFRIYRILKDGFAEVPAYKESHEIFMTTNYMAVSRSSKKQVNR